MGSLHSPPTCAQPYPRSAEQLDCWRCPVNDTEQGYDYPARVRWSLAQDDVKSYQEAAEFLNFNNIDMVCLQHEYGIFGGPAGSHILHLLRGLKMPVVTTLHTVLREPDPNQLMVMEEIAELSDRLIVMSQLSSQFLQEIFKVPGSKIDMVPHGVPDLPFLDPEFLQGSLWRGRESGVCSRSACSRRTRESKTSFKRCRRFCPNTRMLRTSSQARPILTFCVAKETSIEPACRLWRRKWEWKSQVIFHDRFVSPEEMAEFIGAADIYITPYRYEAQVVSGTLAYALGAGKAIISTPYWHAIELLDDRRGALVPFQNPDAIAHKAIELLDTPAIAMPCVNAPICLREIWSGKEWRKVTWKVLPACAATAWRVRAVQFSARADPKIAGSVA